MGSIEVPLPCLQRSSTYRTTSDSSVCSYPELRDMNRLSQHMEVSPFTTDYSKDSPGLGHNTHSIQYSRNFEGARIPISIDDSRAPAVGATTRQGSIRRKTASLVHDWRLAYVMKGYDKRRAHVMHKSQREQQECTVKQIDVPVPGGSTGSVLSRARSFLSRSVDRTRRSLRVRLVSSSDTCDGLNISLADSSRRIIFHRGSDTLLDASSTDCLGYSDKHLREAIIKTPVLVVRRCASVSRSI